MASRSTVEARRSKYWVLGLPCLVFVAGVVLAAQNDQRPVFRSGVEIVELEVSVLDRERRPVRGLTAGDFSLLENGKPLRIVQFSEVEFPESEGPRFASQEIAAPDLTSDRFADRRLFVIVLDDFSLASGPGGGFAQGAILAPEVKQAARAVIRSLGPKDFAAVMLTRDPRPFPDFTNMESKLSGTIDQFRPPSDLEALSLLQSTGGRVGLVATVRAALRYMAKLPQHSKTIVYIGQPPPVDFARRSLSAFADRVEDAISDARTAGIGIFGFDVSGRLDRSATGLLLALAENTGGRAFGYSNLDAGVAQVFAENHSYYLLGFEPTGLADGKFRRLEVKVARPGTLVRAPRGYNAPAKPDMVKAEPLPFDAAVDAALVALAKGSEGRRLFTYAAARAGVLAVATELSMNEVAQKVWAGGADVEVTVMGGAGVPVGRARGRIEAGSRSALVDVPLAGGTGPFRANVTVRAPGASLDDAADAQGAGVWLGPARMFRAAVSPRAPLTPVAEFQFARTERIRVEWPELQPLDRREVRLLRRTGEPIAPLAATATVDATGQALLAVALPLATVAPGEYLLEVVAGRGSETDRQVVAFRVVQ